MSYLPGKFVWFEHVSCEVAKAKTFYTAWCGWTVQPMPAGEQAYDLILNGAYSIGGFRAAQTRQNSHWIAYLSVPDVDQAFAAANAAGGKGLMPPTAFGEIGRGAAVADPTGVALFLWRGADGDPPDLEKTPVGSWFWNELASSDVNMALAFYQEVFGFDHDAMDMGPMGTYYVLKDPTGKARAGLMQQPAGMSAASSWLPYLHVADCDAAVAKATQLGAALLRPPTDIPDVGRFAVMQDPVGAVIAVIKGV
jgi:predicted enzyme related to lactoylglutathione lyase